MFLKYIIQAQAPRNIYLPPPPKRKNTHSPSSFHVLLPEVDQYATHGALTRLRPANGHVGIQRVPRRVVGVIPVGEAYAKGGGWIAHEEGSTRHEWHAVGIGMGEFEEFRFRFLVGRYRCAHARGDASWSSTYQMLWRERGTSVKYYIMRANLA